MDNTPQPLSARLLVAPAWDRPSGRIPREHRGVCAAGVGARIPMFDRRYDPMFLRGIFDQTRVLRRPITNIVVGYHVLPFILVGPDVEMERRAVEIRGKIRVSPRLVIRPGGSGQTYGEVFGESELMDQMLVGRLFAFRYASRRHAVIESEDLAIRPAEGDAEARIERIFDDLARREVLDTGLILSPDVKFYPVSIDRFLHEILDRELGE